MRSLPVGCLFCLNYCSQPESLKPSLLLEGGLGWGTYTQTLLHHLPRTTQIYHFYVMKGLTRRMNLLTDILHCAAASSHISAATTPQYARGGIMRTIRCTQRKKPSFPRDRCANSAPCSLIPARHFSGSIAQIAIVVHKFVSCIEPIANC